MKRKKNSRFRFGEFKQKVVADILRNELSYSQTARKYNFYIKSVYDHSVEIQTISHLVYFWLEIKGKTY